MGPAAALEATVLMIAVSIVGPLCAVIAATTAQPIADGILLEVDAELFFNFDRRKFIAVVAQWPLVMSLMAWCYNSMIVQPFILIFCLAGLKGEEFLWRFTSAWAIALAISIIIFPFVPAYGTPPYVLDFIDILKGARDGSLTTLGVHTLTGIITFPSFHAAAAVLLGWGWWKIDRLRIIGLVLNVLMMISAVVGGGHYLIDLFAGAAVAMAALRLAKLWQYRSVRVFSGEPIPC